MENTRAYTKVTISGAYGLYNHVRLQDGTTDKQVSFPQFSSDLTSTSPNLSAEDFVVDYAQFSRNGLSYQFIKGAGEAVERYNEGVADYPHFLLSSNMDYLYLYPQIETGHPFEEAILSLCLYPKYPEE